MPDKLRVVYKLAAITRVKLLLILLLILSCERNVPTQINSGDIFKLCDSIKNCGNEFYCNPSELFFIDDKTFCLIDYSEIPYGNKNMAGNYRITSDSIFLTFNTKIVISGMEWKGEPYVSDGNTYLKVKNEDINPLSFKIDRCQNNALMLTNAQIKKYSLGFKTKENMKKEMSELLESNEWKELK